MIVTSELPMNEEKRHFDSRRREKANQVSRKYSNDDEDVLLTSHASCGSSILVQTVTCARIKRYLL